MGIAVARSSKETDVNTFFHPVQRFAQMVAAVRSKTVEEHQQIRAAQPVACLELDGERTPPGSLADGVCFRRGWEAFKEPSG